MKLILRIKNLGTGIFQIKILDLLSYKQFSYGSVISTFVPNRKKRL